MIAATSGSALKPAWNPLDLVERLGVGSSYTRRGVEMFCGLLTFLRRHIALVVVAFIALGGTAYAVSGSAGSSTKTYYACVTKQHGTLNLTTKAATCPRGQRKISFNAKGAQGARGENGAAGATGAPGPAGPQGVQGPQGERGPSVLGSPGTKGDTGAPGPKGDTGAAGPKGDTGAAGPKGDTGAAGPKGDTGAAGPKGDTGAVGATGPAGPKGDTGAAGATGAKGDTGAT